MTITASFWSFASMNQYVVAVPYTQNSALTGPYLWSNQGVGNLFSRPANSPGCRVGAIVGQFLFLGDLYQQLQQTLFISTGVETTYSGTLATPIADGGQVLSQQGAFTATFSNGLVLPNGNLSGGTINYATGAITLTFSAPMLPGDRIYASYTQVAPYRCAWSAIGNPTNWPTPLTNAALAAQSGINDLQVDLGPVMFVAGYPLYGLVFQKHGITRASYTGGNVVFSWQPYELKRGLIAHGAVVQVGAYTYFLDDEGFYITDGANVVPIGTTPDNSAGIDKWFWSNVNASALEAIRAGYDASKRSVFFAIPTGSNVLPDTLLIYNVLSQKWTRANVATETIWTADNGQDTAPGTKHLLGIMDQTHAPNFLTGSPLTGYLESCDVFFMDGARRLTVGARPHVNAIDPPLITIGVRNSLQDPVAYGTGTYPDAFSKVAPAMSGGIYTRARLQSGNATSIHGATLLMEQQGSV